MMPRRWNVGVEGKNIWLLDCRVPGTVSSAPSHERLLGSGSCVHPAPVSDAQSTNEAVSEHAGGSGVVHSQTPLSPRSFMSTTGQFAAVAFGYAMGTSPGCQSVQAASLGRHDWELGRGRELCSSLGRSKYHSPLICTRPASGA